MPETLINRVKNRILDMTGSDFSLSYPFPLSLLKYILYIISLLYGAAVNFRLYLYRSAIIKSRRVPALVISIGNVTAGGSGKTPMAVYMAELMIRMGLKPLVLSRGYRGSAGSFAVAGNGVDILASPAIVGDEPFMMAARRRFPVAVGPDRFKAAMLSIDYFGSRNIDVIILDDGFQHLSIRRDIDIVLMDYRRPSGNGKLIPAGRLRENFELALKRADIVIFTRYDSDLSESRGSGRIKLICNSNSNKIPAPLFRSSHKPFLYLYTEKLIRKDVSLDHLRGRSACLFSGIADNKGFRESVGKLGIEIKAYLEFSDHHMYKSDEISAILESYRASGADLLITTEKDFARLGLSADNPFSCSKDLSGRHVPAESSSVSSRLKPKHQKNEELLHLIERMVRNSNMAVIGIRIDFLDETEAFEKFIRRKICRSSAIGTVR